MLKSTAYPRTSNKLASHTVLAKTYLKLSVQLSYLLVTMDTRTLGNGHHMHIASLARACRKIYCGLIGLLRMR